MKYFFAAGLLGLGACTAANLPVEDLEYTPPAKSSAISLRDRVAQHQDNFIPLAAASLRQQGFDIQVPDGGEQALITHYSGDPAPYIDCGMIRTKDGNDLPAASQSMVLSVFSETPHLSAVREMELNARALTRTETGADGTAFSTIATFVVTRKIATRNNNGEELGRAHETISFESGGVGRFSNNTSCISKGIFENAINRDIVVAATGGGIDQGLKPIDMAINANENIAPATQASTPVAQVPVAPAQTTGAVSATKLPPPTGVSVVATIPSAAQRAQETAPQPDLPRDIEPDAGPVAVPSQPVAPPSASTPQTEELAFSQYLCSDLNLSMSQGGNGTVTGYVATHSDLEALRQQVTGRYTLDVDVLAPGGCGLLNFVENLTRPDLGLANAYDKAVIQRGEPLDLEVKLKGDKRYFHMVRLASDGLVHHLGTSYIDPEQIGDNFVYQTEDVVKSTPFREMFVALASSRNLYNEQRTGTESVSDFIANFRKAAAEQQTAPSAAKLIVQN